MSDTEPVAELDPRFSDPDAVAVLLAGGARGHREGRALLDLDGPSRRPPPRHPAADGVARRRCVLLHRGRRAEGRQPGEERHCALTTGNNAWKSGLDIVIEGRAERVQRRRSPAGAGRRVGDEVRRRLALRRRRRCVPARKRRGTGLRGRPDEGPRVQQGCVSRRRVSASPAPDPAEQVGLQEAHEPGAVLVGGPAELDGEQVEQIRARRRAVALSGRNAGHLLMVENPDALAEGLRAYCAAPSARRSGPGFRSGHAWVIRRKRRTASLNTSGSSRLHTWPRPGSTGECGVGEGGVEVLERTGSGART